MKNLPILLRILMGLIVFDDFLYIGFQFFWEPGFRMNQWIARILMISLEIYIIYWLIGRIIRLVTKEFKYQIQQIVQEELRHSRVQ